MRESKYQYSKSQRATGWYKDLSLLMMVTALAGSSVTVQMGVLPLYVKSLGGSNALSGLIVGMLGISALMFRIPIGYMLDRFGRKPLLILGLLILSIDFFVLSIWSTIIALLILRFIQGAGNSTQSTATGALASDIIPREKITVGLGYFSIAQSIPQALGPVIGLSIATTFGYRYLFVGSLIIVCIALFLSNFLPDYYRNELKKTSTLDKQQQNLKNDMKDILKNKMVVIPSLIVFLICLSNSGVVTFIVQYARQRGIHNSGYYFLVVSLVTIMTRLFSRKVLDNFKRKQITIVSIIAIICSFYLISIAKNSLQLFIAGALYGLGYAFLLPIMNAVVLSNVSRTQRGSAVAVFSASLDVAFGGGAIFWGVIASILNFSIMYKICSFLCVISGIIFLVTYSKKDEFEKIR